MIVTYTSGGIIASLDAISPLIFLYYLINLTVCAHQSYQGQNVNEVLERRYTTGNKAKCQQILRFFIITIARTYNLMLDLATKGVKGCQL